MTDETVKKALSLLVVVLLVGCSSSLPFAGPDYDSVSIAFPENVDQSAAEKYGNPNARVITDPDNIDGEYYDLLARTTCSRGTQFVDETNFSSSLVVIYQEYGSSSRPKNHVEEVKKENARVSIVLEAEDVDTYPDDSVTQTVLIRVQIAESDDVDSVSVEHSFARFNTTIQRSEFV